MLGGSRAAAQPVASYVELSSMELVNQSVNQLVSQSASQPISRSPCTTKPFRDFSTFNVSNVSRTNPSYGSSELQTPAGNLWTFPINITLP
jgi:hypothetical protein